MSSAVLRRFPSRHGAEEKRGCKLGKAERAPLAQPDRPGTQPGGGSPDLGGPAARSAELGRGFPVAAVSQAGAQPRRAGSVLSEGRRCRAGRGAPRSLPPDLGSPAPTSPARPNSAGPQNVKTMN